MSINNLNVDKVLINTDNIGGLKAITLKAKLNLAMTVIIPIANNILTGFSVAIPDHFTSYFLLSDIIIGYYNSYLMLGVTITFVGPTTEEIYSSSFE
jgi:hypothetical protein